MNNANKRLMIYIMILIITIMTMSAGASTHDPVVDIGNITRVQGVRDNQLIGYGIVIGLAGTGDSSRSKATVQSVANMLKKFGVNVTSDQVRSKNIAAVMVTAKLPPFTYAGDKLDVTISSLGDATNLQGGTLLMTPLKAGNEKVYAVAQGAISIGGFNVNSGGSQTRENHPTVARIPNGALVERELKIDLEDKDHINLLLDNPNYTTACNIVKAINDNFAVGGIAQAVDPGNVRIEVPDTYKWRIVEFISNINKLDVNTNLKAKVIIDEKTGTIVFSHNVRISTVAVAHGNLTVTIKSTEEVSQPPSFSEGETEKVTNTEIEVKKGEGNIVVVGKENTIEDLVTALNTIGVSPRDIVSIIQKIKAAGALHAELELI